MNLKNTIIAISLLTSTLIIFQACGGGGGPTPVTKTRNHYFYVDCEEHTSCSSNRLYKFTDDSLILTKIGNIDSIVPSVSGNVSAGRSNLYLINNKIYFVGDKTVNSINSPPGIFEYDPNLPEATGTNPKFIEIPDHSSSLIGIDNLVAYGTKLFFKATTNTYGAEIMVFDTTLEPSTTNPSVAVDLSPGSGTFNVRSLKIAGDRLMFTANDPANSATYEPFEYLLTSSVSPTNPKFVYDIYGSGNHSFAEGYTELDGKIYFKGNSFSGYEFFKYDPAVTTGASNPELIDLRSGITSSDPQWFAISNGKLYFKAHDGTTNRLFVLDPAIATSSTNPSVLYDIAGVISEDVTYVTAIGNNVYFIANDTVGTNASIYKFNTTEVASNTNPSLISNSSSTNLLFHSHLFSAGNALFFKASPDGGTTFYNYSILDVTKDLTPTKIPETNSGGVNTYSATWHVLRLEETYTE